MSGAGFEPGDRLEIPDEHRHGRDVALGLVELAGSAGTVRALVLKIGDELVVLDADDARRLADRLLEGAGDLEAPALRSRLT